jgi:hypothetical protein
VLKKIELSGNGEKENTIICILVDHAPDDNDDNGVLGAEGAPGCEDIYQSHLNSDAHTRDAAQRALFGRRLLF